MSWGEQRLAAKEQVETRRRRDSIPQRFDTLMLLDLNADGQVDACEILAAVRLRSS